MKGALIVSNPMLEILKDIRLLNLLSSISGTNNTAYDHKYIQKSTRSGNVSSGQAFAPIIREASKKYGVQEELIAAVIQQESSFRPQAQSRCGAQGLMQLMPATARSLGVKNAFDPEENIMGGTRYLKQKLDEFNGNVSMALAAYNAGSSAVKKYGGVPPYQETRQYVQKIIKSVDHLV